MQNKATARRVVIYARISVTNEESVSLDRQVEAGRKYAAARGWQVVDVFLDDGVSATANRPEDRAGWRALLGSEDEFSAVVVWKVDRLARRVLDFLHADQALSARGAGLVAVDDPVDMTTAQGRAFATMLAVFGELEAAAISARVAAARSHLLRAGRVVGGTVPYGWQSVPNPDGPGFVLMLDPERSEWVRGMADRVMSGASIYSVTQWLDAEGAPLPQTSQANRKNAGWRHGTVENLLRNPLVAGMTSFNPGNGGRRRGTEVLRDEDGLPVVDESIAILEPHRWRALVKALDERDSPQSRPRAMKGRTSALLSGLVWCGMHADDPIRMRRGTTQKRESYHCHVCGQTISNLNEYAVERFLADKGAWDRWSVVEEVHEGGAAVLPEIEHRLSELAEELRSSDDDDRVAVIVEQMANLRAMRREARERSPQIVMRPARDEVLSFSEDWSAAEGVEEQRAVLDDAIARVWVMRGRRGGHGVDPARVVIEYHQPEQVGPAADHAAQRESAI